MTESLTKMRLDDDEYNEFRDALESICKSFPGSYWRELENRPVEDRYPREFVDTLMESGFLAALLPEEYGGAGLPIRTASVILETIHSTGCNTSAAIGQMYLPDILVRHGSDDQKQKYLPDIAAGELRFLAYAVNERGSGADIANLATTAEKRDDCYLVNGTKQWVSCAMETDLLLLLARTAPAGEGDDSFDGISTFLVDMRSALGSGVKAEVFDAMINGNAADLEFDNLELPLDAVIGSEGKGYDYYSDLVSTECILYAACALGDSDYFAARAVNYANERVVFGRSISHYQGIQFPISKAYTEVQAARLMGIKTAILYDAGQRSGPQASMAKHLATDAAWAMAEACFTTHGGFAFAREYDIERKWRDVRIMRMGPGTTNMLLADIAENQLGMPRSY